MANGAVQADSGPLECWLEGPKLGLDLPCQVLLRLSDDDRANEHWVITPTDRLISDNLDAIIDSEIHLYKKVVDSNKRLVVLYRDHCV